MEKLFKFKVGKKFFIINIFPICMKITIRIEWPVIADPFQTSYGKCCFNVVRFIVALPGFAYKTGYSIL